MIFRTIEEYLESLPELLFKIVKFVADSRMGSIKVEEILKEFDLEDDFNSLICSFDEFNEFNIENRSFSLFRFYNIYAGTVSKVNIKKLCKSDIVTISQYIRPALRILAKENENDPRWNRQ